MLEKIADVFIDAGHIKNLLLELCSLDTTLTELLINMYLEKTLKFRKTTRIISEIRNYSHNELFKIIDTFLFCN